MINMLSKLGLSVQWDTLYVHVHLSLHDVCGYKI